MKKAAPKSTIKKKSGGKSHPSIGRKIGYIVVIAIMIVLIYLLRHAREWGLTILTEEFSKCLFYIELSIYVTIASQVLFILYDNLWFKHLIQGLANIAGALSIIMIYVIFPFNIEDASVIKWVKIGILIVFGLTVISVIVEIVKGIRYLARDPEAA
jgi:hypothetical protein